MTRKPSCHLLDMLAQVPDPRHKKGKRHPLKALLALAVIALRPRRTAETQRAQRHTEIYLNS